MTSDRLIRRLVDALQCAAKARRAIAHPGRPRCAAEWDALCREAERHLEMEAMRRAALEPEDPIGAVVSAIAPVVIGQEPYAREWPRRDPS